ncbi:phage late control D family protein [Labrys portucalensis]|uniref:Phage late control D family protein n=1 Tax=Labrys neptuniae TaxID=376174 RepID=A0ABV6ZK21_9HYPH|nr:hypothetical protein [Labrys sp. WJW]OCC05278.1 hypothetical protein BA190_10265 [Labrys sp. WJW]
MARQAVFYVSVGGKDVSGSLEPYVESITITDASGSTSDAAEIELNDADGQILLPPKGTPISIGLGWAGEGTMVSFEGVVDTTPSQGGRGEGTRLSITAKSADQNGKLKERRQRHKDKGKLKDVAEAWGKDAGLSSVHIDESLGNVERDYWAMLGESYTEWGVRIAAELGATFKVAGDKAAMVPRNAGKSASGKSLPTIYATKPGNLIAWRISPTEDAHRWQKYEVSWYDAKQAKHRKETVEVKPEEGSDGPPAPKAGHVHRFRAASKDAATARAKSAKADAERESGSGSITIDGDPSAQAEALCILAGTRDGVDGTYRIDTAKHSLSRGSGYICELTLKQPQGDAGKDKRGSK